MKKLKDVFAKAGKRRGHQELPDHWSQAIEAVKNVGTPMADLDSSRPERSRAAFACLALGGREDLEMVKKHPKVKEYLKELRHYR